MSISATNATPTTKTAVRQVPGTMRAVEVSAFRVDALNLVERPILQPGRGEVMAIVILSDSGQVATSAIGHFLDMDENDRTKVRRWVGAFGPLSW